MRDVVIEWGSGGMSTSEETLTRMINSFLESYKGIVVGVLGAATLTMVLIGLYLLLNLGSNSSNVAGKNLNMRRLLIWAVSLALLGSLDIIVALIYNVLR